MAAEPRYAIPPKFFLGALWCGSALPQEDKKTDDLTAADPDAGKGTVAETTLGLLPNPLENAVSNRGD